MSSRGWGVAESAAVSQLLRMLSPCFDGREEATVRVRARIGAATVEIELSDESGRTATINYAPLQKGYAEIDRAQFRWAGEPWRLENDA